MRFGVYRHQHADILAVHVESAANGHGVDRIVLAFNQLRLAHDAVNGYVEAVIVLRRQPKDAQCTPSKALRILRVRIAKESLQTELAPLDPNGLSFRDLVEHNRPAVGWRCYNLRLVWCRARSRIGLELAVEELVE